MFGAGENAVLRAGLRSLESEDLRTGDGCSEVGIFTGAFDHASPTGIAGDIEHGREGPGDAGGAGFARRYGLRGFNELGIPGRGHGDRSWKDRVIAVDDVEPEENGNMEALFIDRNVLHAVDLLGI